MPKPPGQTSFNVLVAIFFLAISGLVGALWYLTLAKNTSFFYVFISLSNIIISLLFLLFFSGFIGLLIARKKKSLPKSLVKVTGVFVKIFFPLLIKLGTIFKIPEEFLQANVIHWLNQINDQEGISLQANELLVLIPHCLQYSGCSFHVVHDLKNCKRCGKCPLDRLIALKDEIGFKMFVVTGGTLARKIVQENKPQAIVAVACERDLVSGMIDVFPYRTLGQVNLRPYGPCFNTAVDLEELVDKIYKFIPQDSLDRGKENREKSS